MNVRPAYVKPYVKRQKNDATDAEAICEFNGRRRPGSAVTITMIGWSRTQSDRI